MGDIVFEFIQDVFMCQFWTKNIEPKKNVEKQAIMDSYFEFVVNHRRVLELGTYHTVTARPTFTFKEPMTQEVIALNAPDLSKDGDLLR